MNKNYYRNMHIKTNLIFFLFVAVITILCSISKFESLNILSVLLSISYLTSFKKIHMLQWSEIGFRISETLENIKCNFGLIVVVSIVFQLTVIFMCRFLYPDYFIHLYERIPLQVTFSHIVEIIITLIYVTFFEEIIYRCFIQGVLSGIINKFGAIIITSIIFTLMNLNYEYTYPVLIIDIGCMVIENIIYGVVYDKTRNVFSSWISHFILDLFLLASLLFL